MNLLSFDEELQDLSSAEDFLTYFAVPFDQRVVHVNRLHILQRFHDYLAQASESMPEGDEPRREVLKRLLERAYQDFVTSDALTEKVFRVFHDPPSNFLPLADVKCLPGKSGD